MLNKITPYLQSRILDHFSWKSTRKLLVLESDDWGSIRMPSRAVYNYLLKKGLKVDQDPFWKYDALESVDDLGELFNVLSLVHDANGRPACLTANSLMANPDFKRIKESKFRKYYYQPVGKTFASYPRHAMSKLLWKEGAAAGLFHPQFHGREHINIPRWMSALQQGDPEAHLAFQAGTFGTGRAPVQGGTRSYLHALAADTPEDAAALHTVVRKGMRMFEQCWGFRSGSFIAPCYRWSTDIEETLAKAGVHTIQGNRYQFETRMLPAVHPLRKAHYTGKTNALGQVYLVRNCYFEPGAYQKDWVQHCLNEIALCFRSGKPAIIGSHRMNYIGFIHPENRDKNLKLLNQLLRSIVRKWPEVEFMTSDELGKLIKQH